jgi:hypothetical protein
MSRLKKIEALEENTKHYKNGIENTMVWIDKEKVQIARSRETRKNDGLELKEISCQG